VAQGVDPQFKPQDCKKKSNNKCYKGNRQDDLQTVTVVTCLVSRDSSEEKAFNLKPDGSQQVWGHKPVIPGLRRWRQEDHSLGPV
jgi:hypothetical protein